MADKNFYFFRTSYNGHDKESFLWHFGLVSWDSLSTIHLVDAMLALPNTGTYTKPFAVMEKPLQMKVTPFNQYLNQNLNKHLN